MVMSCFCHEIKRTHRLLSSFIAGKFACPVCNRYFSQMGHCKRHIRNQHGDVQTADCSVCGATLKNVECLKEHMRNKHNAYQTF